MQVTTRRSLLTVAVAVVAIGAWGAYARFFSGAVPSPAPSEESDVMEKPVIIGLSLASYRENRWKTEAGIIEAEAEKHGASVMISVADGDPVLQVAQAKSLLQQGANVLIVVAQDSEKAGAIVQAAHEKGAKVIAYDRLIRSADLDYYISFDNAKVGESQAYGVLEAVGGKGDFAYIGGSPTDNNAKLVRDGSFSILQPKIDSGDVKIVLDRQIPDWNADIAYKEVDNFLDRGGKLDAAVVANDGMAGGVIKALREHGLAGKIPVSGQDAELRACQDIVTGEQTATVYKPLRKLAEEAVLMAVAAARGQQIRINANVNNGQVNVPSRLLNVVMVTKDNLDSTVILDGLHPREDVYKTK